MRRALLLGVTAALVAGCGGGPERLPAVTDDMACDRVAEVVQQAVDEAVSFIGTGGDDAEAADIVFALSGAEERPECVDGDLRNRAAGLRATLNSGG